MKTVGKTRLDDVRNQDIREQCGTQPIWEWVNKRREEWNNDTSRMTAWEPIRRTEEEEEEEEEEEGPSKANVHSSSQEIPCLSWKSKV
jgi:hypothetical protein